MKRNAQAERAARVVSEFASHCRETGFGKCRVEDHVWMVGQPESIHFTLDFGRGVFFLHAAFRRRSCRRFRQSEQQWWNRGSASVRDTTLDLVIS